MDIINAIENEYKKEDIVPFKIGDTVDVHIKIKEGNKERIQVFEGIIIKKQGGGVNETFTVRRISYGVGVEKTFLVHSPMIEKIEVVRVGRARRAKLYYLRDRVGKAAKTKEKVGAKIETKMLTIKEEVVPGESVEAENAENTEDIVAAEEVEENVTTTEEVKAEVKEEAPKAEKEEKKEEAKAEETAEDSDDKKED